MARDLTADRGEALQRDIHAPAAPGGDSMEDAFLNALNGDKAEADPDEEEEEEEEEEEDEEETEPEDEEPASSDYEIEGLGKVSKEEISTAFEALNYLEETQQQVQALTAQVQEMKVREASLAPAMELQALLNIPQVALAIKAAVGQVAQENPGLLQKQAQADPQAKKLETLVHKTESFLYQQEVKQHEDTIGGFFDDLAKEYGKGWPSGTKEQVVNAALRRYGDHLNMQILEDFTYRYLAEKKITPEPKKSPKEQIDDAVAKHGRKVMVLKGGSRRQIPNRAPDPRRLSEREFQSVFEKGL